MRNKVAVSSYSFSNVLYSEKMPSLEDFFRTAKELGLDGVELVAFNILDRDTPIPMGFGDPDKSPDPILPDGSQPNRKEEAPRKMDPEKLKVFQEIMSNASRKRPASIDAIKGYLEKYGLEVCNMPIDFGDIGNPDADARKADIKMLKMWIDIAAELGSPSVRFNSGSVNRDAQGNLDLSLCISSYRELARYGAQRNVVVTMENHGGATEQPEACVAIFEGVNDPNYQLTPDLGNFHLGEGMYRGVDMMFACGKPLCVHVKTYAFDPAYGEGCDSHTDFKRMAEIVHSHKYDGWYSIECNGACGKDYANVIRTKELIDKFFQTP
jgi:sugar phosphate isomerase/epimerase